MEQSILDNLGAVESDKYVGDMFISGLRYYVMNVHGVDVYFSEYDSTLMEDLRPKGLVEFYYRFKGWHNTVKMSKEIVETDIPFVIQELEECIKSIKQSAHVQQK